MTGFFRQDVQIRRQAGYNGSGGVEFDAPVTIKARMVGDVRRVIDGRTGQEVTSTTKVSTAAPVSVGDEVMDESGTFRPVRNVSEARDTNGRLSHRIARL